MGGDSLSSYLVPSDALESASARLSSSAVAVAKIKNGKVSDEVSFQTRFSKSFLSLSMLTSANAGVKREIIDFVKEYQRNTWFEDFCKNYVKAGRNDSRSIKEIDGGELLENVADSFYLFNNNSGNRIDSACMRRRMSGNVSFIDQPETPIGQWRKRGISGSGKALVENLSGSLTLIGNENLTRHSSISGEKSYLANSNACLMKQAYLQKLFMYTSEFIPSFYRSDVVCDVIKYNTFTDGDKDNEISSGSRDIDIKDKKSTNTRNKKSTSIELAEEKEEDDYPLASQSPLSRRHHQGVSINQLPLGGDNGASPRGLVGRNIPYQTPSLPSLGNVVPESDRGASPNSASVSVSSTSDSHRLLQLSLSRISYSCPAAPAGSPACRGGGKKYLSNVTLVMLYMYAVEETETKTRQVLLVQQQSRMAERYYILMLLLRPFLSEECHTIRKNYEETSLLVKIKNEEVEQREKELPVLKLKNRQREREVGQNREKNQRKTDNTSDNNDYKRSRCNSKEYDDDFDEMFSTVSKAIYNVQSSMAETVKDSEFNFFNILNNKTNVSSVFFTSTTTVAGNSNKINGIKKKNNESQEMIPAFLKIGSHSVNNTIFDNTNATSDTFYTREDEKKKLLSPVPNIKNINCNSRISLLRLLPSTLSSLTVLPRECFSPLQVFKPLISLPYYSNSSSSAASARNSLRNSLLNNFKLNERDSIISIYNNTNLVTKNDLLKKMGNNELINNRIRNSIDINIKNINNNLLHLLPSYFLSKKCPVCVKTTEEDDLITLQNTLKGIAKAGLVIGNVNIPNDKDIINNKSIHNLTSARTVSTVETKLDEKNEDKLTKQSFRNNNLISDNKKKNSYRDQKSTCKEITYTNSIDFYYDENVGGLLMVLKYLIPDVLSTLFNVNINNRQIQVPSKVNIKNENCNKYNNIYLPHFRMIIAIMAPTYHRFFHLMEGDSNRSRVNYSGQNNNHGSLRGIKSNRTSVAHGFNTPMSPIRDINEAGNDRNNGSQLTFSLSHRNKTRLSPILSGASSRASSHSSPSPSFTSPVGTIRNRNRNFNKNTTDYNNNLINEWEENGNDDAVLLSPASSFSTSSNEQPKFASPFSSCLGDNIKNANKVKKNYQQRHKDKSYGGRGAVAEKHNDGKKGRIRRLVSVFSTGDEKSRSRSLGLGSDIFLNDYDDNDYQFDLCSNNDIDDDFDVFVNKNNIKYGSYLNKNGNISKMSKDIFGFSNSKFVSSKRINRYDFIVTAIYNANNNCAALVCNNTMDNSSITYATVRRYRHNARLLTSIWRLKKEELKDDIINILKKFNEEDNVDNGFNFSQVKTIFDNNKGKLCYFCCYNYILDNITAFCKDFFIESRGNKNDIKLVRKDKSDSRKIKSPLTTSSLSYPYSYYSLLSKATIILATLIVFANNINSKSKMKITFFDNNAPREVINLHTQTFRHQLILFIPNVEQLLLRLRYQIIQLQQSYIIPYFIHSGASNKANIIFGITSSIDNSNTGIGAIVLQEQYRRHIIIYNYYRCLITQIAYKRYIREYRLLLFINYINTQHNQAYSALELTFIAVNS